MQAIIVIVSLIICAFLVWLEARPELEARIHARKARKTNRKYSEKYGR